jgi:hypothetical protein
MRLPFPWPLSYGNGVTVKLVSVCVDPSLAAQRWV